MPCGTRNAPPAATAVAPTPQQDAGQEQQTAHNTATSTLRDDATASNINDQTARSSMPRERRSRSRERRLARRRSTTRSRSPRSPNDDNREARCSNRDRDRDYRARNEQVRSHSPYSDVNDNDAFNDSDSDLSAHGSHMSNEYLTDINDISDGNESFIDDESKQLEAAANDIITANYGTVQKEQHLAAPISDLLASTIDNWATKVPNKEEIKSAFQACKIPTNSVALGPIKINDIIYNRLPFRAKENDKKLRNSASYMKRAMGPLTFIWDTLIKAQAYNIKKKLDPPLRLKRVIQLFHCKN